MDKIFIIKDVELKILLAAVGIEHLCGFKQAGSVKEENIPYIIHEMARHEILRLNGDRLFINEPYLTIAQGIKDAKAVLSVKYDEMLCSTVVLYIGKNIIELSDSITDKDAVRINIKTFDEIYEFIDDVFSLREEIIYPDEIFLEEASGGDESLIVKAELMDKNAAVLREWRMFKSRYGSFVESFAEGKKINAVPYKEWGRQDIERAVYKLGGLYDTD